MRLAEACLPSQQRDAERATLNPAQQLNAKTLVHLGKVHLWTIRHQAWRQTLPLFLQQTDLPQFAFILTVRWWIEIDI